MNTQQNTTERQQLDDLVKLIKLVREEGTPVADSDGRNDHQVIFICNESGRKNFFTIIFLYTLDITLIQLNL